ncbi:hypothetical protein GJ744_009257 [Endocarpon pusillum]|uniref:Uncharacterized protein n=1 Tax=Endocarpon pusillum TaxID=364733 RepID=A0A8H7E2S5_9EURO|nr:hypothetical protein GJ744_009257 [Endocarpon pusillum]
MADKISITICGDGGCGKSSITLRLVRSQWTQEYDPTIEDSYSVTRTIEGRSYHLYLTDTAGQEEYRSFWASSNLSSDAFLLVYDLTNPSSLDALTHYMEMIDIETEHRIEQNASLLKSDGGVLGEEERKLVKSMPVKIVAGNKCDLKADRKISARQGLNWARRRGCGFMETSAREVVNIEETFALIVRRVIEARRQCQINPINPSLYNSANTSARTSIMNLTKENALKAAAGGGDNDTRVAMARTPALLRPTTAEYVDAEKRMMVKKGESTRLDGRPVRRRSILGKGVSILGKLKCWGKTRRR